MAEDGTVAPLVLSHPMGLTDPGGVVIITTPPHTGPLLTKACVELHPNLGPPAITGPPVAMGSMPTQAHDLLVKYVEKWATLP